MIAFTWSVAFRAPPCWQPSRSVAIAVPVDVLNCRELVAGYCVRWRTCSNAGSSCGSIVAGVPPSRQVVRDERAVRLRWRRSARLRRTGLSEMIGVFGPHQRRGRCPIWPSQRMTRAWNRGDRSRRQQTVRSWTLARAGWIGPHV